MDQTLNATPSGVRTQIGFFGPMNAGKSSLINALTGQEVSIVSPEAGTTTDVVRKSMEIHGLGPCVLLDTAGFDDETPVGLRRVAAARKAAERTDLAVLLFTGKGFAQALEWLRFFRALEVPCLAVISRTDEREAEENRELAENTLRETGLRPVLFSAKTGEGREALLEALRGLRSRLPEKRRILSGLVREGDTVLLVMPQDPQAPEGRLILPQAQTIREALDRRCVVMGVQTEELPRALALLREPPALVVTDSQVFDRVSACVPPEIPLTSFSVLFAALKGDIRQYLEGAEAIGHLTEKSRVLIAECCTHAPLEEDIGRVKLPRMLRKRFGEGLQVEITAGDDFPENTAPYDLVIQCGACMLNRRQVMARLKKAETAEVPVTNYGIAIAYLRGMLDRITVPGGEERKEAE